MATKRALLALAKEQLLAIIMARGEAILSGDRAYAIFLKGLDRADAQALEVYIDARRALMVKLATVEEKILAGIDLAAKPN
jgi:hypothetical protein